MTESEKECIKYGMDYASKATSESILSGFERCLDCLIVDVDDKIYKSDVQDILKTLKEIYLR